MIINLTAQYPRKSTASIIIARKKNYWRKELEIEILGNRRENFHREWSSLQRDLETILSEINS